MSKDPPNTSHDATFAVDCAQVSDLGMRRANNQDAIASVVSDRRQWQSRGHLFVVADGMGAHAAGELASKLAVDNLPHHYLKATSLSPPDSLQKAVHKANALIFEKGQSAADFHGMGTTCSCLVLLPEAAIVAHVGDSRVYRLRNQRFEQLTFDHSLVWEMAAASKTTAEEVPDCIPSNVITRSLGPNASVKVDLEGPFPVQPGDKYLLCSDGLTGVVGDELIGSLVNALSPQEAVDTLVDVANLRGGPDNISIIVAEIKTGSEGSASDNSKATDGAMDSVKPSFWRRWLGWSGGSARCKATYIDRSEPFGNGPYRDWPCSPERAVSDIQFLCRELTSLDDDPDSALAEHASVDWLAFRKTCERAALSVEAGTPQESVVGYAAAIRHLMAQIREGSSDSSDSHVL